jgi:hypothetical protein
MSREVGLTLPKPTFRAVPASSGPQYSGVSRGVARNSKDAGQYIFRREARIEITRAMVRQSPFTVAGEWSVCFFLHPRCSSVPHTSQSDAGEQTERAQAKHRPPRPPPRSRVHHHGRGLLRWRRPLAGGNYSLWRRSLQPQASNRQPRACKPLEPHRMHELRGHRRPCPDWQ